MTRVGFWAQVNREHLPEYKERHKAVWPEMLDALQSAGWRNYSLFLRDDGLMFGYVEVDNLADAIARMEQIEINAKWQAEMARFFEQPGGTRPDQGFLQLEEVFHVD